MEDPEARCDGGDVLFTGTALCTCMHFHFFTEGLVPNLKRGIFFFSLFFSWVSRRWRYSCCPFVVVVPLWKSFPASIDVSVFVVGSSNALLPSSPPPALRYFPCSAPFRS
ncbi:unnamed protein product [Pylaiella littoralis]